MGRCEYCSRPTSKNKENVTFHRFPTDSRKSEMWVKNMGRVNWKPRKDSVLCSTHFTKDCFDRMTRMRLVKGSVPTVFHPLSKLILMNERTWQQTPQLEDPLSTDNVVWTAIPNNYQSRPIDSNGLSRTATILKQHGNSTLLRRITSQAIREMVIHDHHYAATPRKRGRPRKKLSSVTTVISTYLSPPLTTI